MYMVASSAADIRDWKTPFSFVEQHIIFMNCINMTCWKCLYFSLISRGRLSSRFWWNINISCGSLISYGVDKIRNSEKENKKTEKCSASTTRGHKVTTEQLHDNEAVAPLGCILDIFLDYLKIDTTEINSLEKVKKQSCILIFFRAFDPDWSISLSGENLQNLTRPRVINMFWKKHFHTKSLSEGLPAALTLVFRARVYYGGIKKLRSFDTSNYNSEMSR